MKSTTRSEAAAKLYLDQFTYAHTRKAQDTIDAIERALANAEHRGIRRAAELWEEDGYIRDRILTLLEDEK